MCQCQPGFRAEAPACVGESVVKPRHSRIRLMSRFDLVLSCFHIFLRFHSELITRADRKEVISGIVSFNLLCFAARLLRSSLLLCPTPSFWFLLFVNNKFLYCSPKSFRIYIISCFTPHLCSFCDPCTSGLWSSLGPVCPEYTVCQGMTCWPCLTHAACQIMRSESLEMVIFIEVLIYVIIFHDLFISYFHKMSLLKVIKGSNWTKGNKRSRKRQCLI